MADEEVGAVSYMRGGYYLWRDDERVHVWVADGYDGWDESIWAEPRAAETDVGARPSGVGVPQAVADEYAVMRVAELLRDGGLAAAVDRALVRHAGNGGCEALAQHAATLRRVAGGAELGTGSDRDDRQQPDR